jgi:hypothetical protein
MIKQIKTITLKGIIDEDFVNYKVPSMTLMFPKCSLKCDKECGQPICQNSSLLHEANITVNIDKLIDRYLNNPITEAVCFQGMEPMDSWKELQEYVYRFRVKKHCEDPIVIYTGYNKYEILDKLTQLAFYKNIIVKYGRYIPGQSSHYDEILGVYLASDNQYAEML